MRKAQILPKSFKCAIDTVNDDIHIVFPAYREKTVLFSVNIYRQMGFSYKLEYLLLKVRVKFFGHNQPVNAFQEREGCLFRERIHCPDPEECK